MRRFIGRRVQPVGPLVRQEHTLPEADTFRHVADSGCPCRPSLTVVTKAGQGYWHRWIHPAVLPDGVPSCLPADWPDLSGLDLEQDGGL